jgi:hypothetical protein
MNKHDTNTTPSGPGAETGADTTTADSQAAGRLQIGWRDGIQCFFDTDGITIDVWGSSWNGMEEVRVDGALVSRQRVLRRGSSHRFTAQDHDFEVRLRCLSMTTGTFIIELLRDGVPIDSDQASPMGIDLTDEEGNINWSRAIRKIGPVFVLSGVAGMLFGYTVAKLVQ